MGALSCQTVHTSHKFTTYEIVFASLLEFHLENPLNNQNYWLHIMDIHIEILIKNMREIAKIARGYLIASKQKSKNYYDSSQIQYSLIKVIKYG